MRVLLSSDLHYKLKQYDWLLKAARRFDAVVIAGDHIDAFWPVPTVVQIAALRASFCGHREPQPRVRLLRQPRPQRPQFLRRESRRLAVGHARPEAVGRR